MTNLFSHFTKSLTTTFWSDLNEDFEYNFIFLSPKDAVMIEDKHDKAIWFEFHCKAYDDVSHLCLKEHDEFKLHVSYKASEYLFRQLIYHELMSSKAVLVGLSKKKNQQYKEIVVMDYTPETKQIIKFEKKMLNNL